MDLCHYETVNNTEKQSHSYGRMKLSHPFLRQLLICSGLWTTYFASGLSMGAPTVVIPQLRKANITLTDETASWLFSAFGYSAIPWVVILPTAARYFGRKPLLFFAITASVTSFIILYIGKNTKHLLISQLIQGVLLASNLTISIMMITEYTSARYRGIFLTVKSASIFWGMWVSNAIGTFYHWNYIGFFGLICSGYYFTIFIWPESPFWLATKGRFDECAKSHRWIKGTDEASEEELGTLIKSHKEILQNVHKIPLIKQTKNFRRIITLKEFYKPLAISLLITAQHQASGKTVCGIFSLELIKKITESESTAYIGMLILDGVSVFGMYIGCAISKVVKRRTLLLIPTSLGILFLFSTSLYLFLVRQGVIVENNIVSILLLSSFSVALSCGPMILSMSMHAELIPTRFKSIGVVIVALLNFMIGGTAIKVAPFIFKMFGLPGTFFCYGTLTLILTYILYKYLPETKDKTLFEIEEYFKEKVDNKEVSIELIVKSKQKK